MKNLKKVLALVMAFALAFTMMAGAAFTDAADIKATEAVNMLTALNVINGNPDGSFKPDGTVTRAEMAKMIYVVMSGGNTDASAYASMSTTFKDINGHWAAGYVKFAQSNGIIAGKSAIQFDPDGLVTGTEAAKMLLVVMGYDAAKGGLVGSGWDNKTVGYATKEGLLDDVNANMAAGLPRQYAAQIIYNTLDADRVKWSNDSESFDTVFISGNTTESVGAKYLKLTKSVGTITSMNKDAFSITQTTADISDSSNSLSSFTKVSQDYSALVGKKVKVLVKDQKANSVIGVYETNDNTSYSAIMNDVEKDGDKLKFGGKSYSADSSINVYRDGVSASAMTVAQFDADSTPDEVTFVDSDGNNKIDTAVIKTVNVKKVTYVSSSQIIAGGTTYKSADENIADGLAKDDWVIVTKNLFNDNNDIVKADKVSATVNGARATEYRLDGTWYDVATGADIKSNVKAGVNVSAVVVNGLIFFAEKTSGTATGYPDVALVVAKGTGVQGSQAKLAFLDGSTKVVDIDDDSDVWVAGQIYEYSVSGSEYKLTTLADDKDEYGDYTYTAGNSAELGAGSATPTTITTYTTSGGNVDGTYKISDSAKVFVWATNAGGTTTDIKVLTGKQLKSTLKFTNGTNDNWVLNDAIGAFTSDEDGLTQVTIAALKYNSTSGSFSTNMDNFTSNDNYGYVVSKGYKINSTYSGFTIWTGSENVDVKVKNSNYSQFSKGAVVGFSSITDDNGDKLINDATIISMTPGAITGVNDKQDKIVIDNSGDQLEIDSDVTVLYVDSDASSSSDIGKQSSGFDKASEIISGVYNINILYSGTTTASDVIVVDVTGKFSTSTTTSASVAAIATGAKLYDADGNQLAASDKLQKGYLLTLENTTAAPVTYTLTNAKDLSGNISVTVANGAKVTLVAIGGAITIA